VTRTHPEPSDVAVDELKRKARRRLIGAIVLALAAAVALPLLFESEPKPLGEDVSVQIPPMDGGKFVTPLSSQLPGKSADKAGPGGPPDKSGSSASPATGNAGASSSLPNKGGTDTRAPASSAAITAPISGGPLTNAPATGPDSAGKAESAKAETPKADAANAEGGSASSPPPFVTAPAPERPSSAKSEPKGEARSDAKASPRAGTGFVVQVAALADPKSASKLVGRLKSAGFPGYSETFPSNGRTMQRVRVGPYTSRESADSARSKLKAAGFSGIVHNK
jgi:DedD protein